MFLSRSAILYLNDDFDGGEFIFTKRDAKTVTVSASVVTHIYVLGIFILNVGFFCPCPRLQARVKPSCGRLLGFSAGPVNPHGVTAVTRGRRCALALWFTKEKLYRDMVSILSCDLLPCRSELLPAVLFVDVVTPALES